MLRHTEGDTKEGGGEQGRSEGHRKGKHVLEMAVDLSREGQGDSLKGQKERKKRLGTNLF